MTSNTISLFGGAAMRVSGPAKYTSQAQTAIRRDDIPNRQTTPSDKFRFLAALARKGAAFSIGPLVVVLGMATLARADFIEILNPSFELPALRDGEFTTGLITGWSAPVAAGVFNPATGFHYSGVGATDGVQNAYIDDGEISQILAESLSVGSYTLRVDVGDRLDNPAPLYSIGLYAGGSLLVDDVSSLSPNDGFLTSTLQFLALAGDLRLGQSLEIRLAKVSGGGQFNFDNVRLEGPRETQAVPEPGSLTLALLGILSFAGWTRRRRASAVS